MNWLERLNDWCGEVLDKSVRYDDLITFSFLAIMLLIAVVTMVMGILGGLGYLK